MVLLIVIKIDELRGDKERETETYFCTVSVSKDADNEVNRNF